MTETLDAFFELKFVIAGIEAFGATLGVKF